MRDGGHKRVPEPPHKITGVVFQKSFLIEPTLENKAR